MPMPATLLQNPPGALTETHFESGALGFRSKLALSSERQGNRHEDNGARRGLLVTITRDGKRDDAVAAVTKLGNTQLLDRVTGKPLFPYKLKRAPASKMPGERAAEYQPVFTLPTPFARQIVFPEDEITDRSPAARAYGLRRMGGAARTAWFEPPELGKVVTFYGIDGGAEWTDAAYDPKTSRLYFCSGPSITWFALSMPKPEWNYGRLRCRFTAQHRPPPTKWTDASSLSYRRPVAERLGARWATPGLPSLCRRADVVPRPFDRYPLSPRSRPERNDPPPWADCGRPPPLLPKSLESGL